MQFILALGNRPKGEVYSYVASFTIFAVSPIFERCSYAIEANCRAFIQILGYYLTVCAVWLTVKAFSVSRLCLTSYCVT